MKKKTKSDLKNTFKELFKKCPSVTSTRENTATKTNFIKFFSKN